MEEETVIKVYFLGPFRLEIDGKEIKNESWNSKKAYHLFKYLSFKNGEKIPRDILMDILWPDSINDKTNNLHTTTYFARKFIKQHIDGNEISFINCSNGLYWLEKNIIWVDFQQYDEYIKQGNSKEKSNPEEALNLYSKAIQLYRGHFLKDDLFADWTTGPRQYYKEQFIDIILRASSLIINLKQDYDEAVDLCKLGLSFDQYREELYHLLISILVEQEKYFEANRVYSKYKKSISQELGLQPDPQIKKIMETINVKNKELSDNINSVSDFSDGRPFLCDIHLFEILYKLQVKRQDRTGKPFTLLKIKITKQNQEQTKKFLLKTLLNSLREVDIITIRGKDEILIHLYQADIEEMQIIKGRLMRKLSKETMDSLQIESYEIKPGGKEILL